MEARKCNPSTQSLRQEGREFKARVCYVARLRVKTMKGTERKHWSLLASVVKETAGGDFLADVVILLGILRESHMTSTVSHSVYTISRSCHSVQRF